MPTVKWTAVCARVVWLAMGPGRGGRPDGDDPAAAQLDPDYAAGKHAIAAKNWSAAIKSLSLSGVARYAQCRHPELSGLRLS